DAQVVAATVAHQHDDSHGAHARHGADGGVPEESPASMTYVLIALAGAAVIAGFIFGWPAAWGGHCPALEHWLAPSLPAQEHVPFADAPHGQELLLQLIGGVLIAGLGCGAACLLYIA